MAQKRFPFLRKKLMLHIVKFIMRLHTQSMKEGKMGRSKICVCKSRSQSFVEFLIWDFIRPSLTSHFFYYPLFITPFHKLPFFEFNICAKINIFVLIYSTFSLFPTSQEWTLKIFLYISSFSSHFYSFLFSYLLAQQKWNRKSWLKAQRIFFIRHSKSKNKRIHPASNWLNLHLYSLTWNCTVHIFCDTIIPPHSKCFSKAFFSFSHKRFISFLSSLAQLILACVCAGKMVLIYYKFGDINFTPLTISLSGNRLSALVTIETR